MSSCLSGGGRAAYGIDLDICKCPSTSTITSSSSSPFSTISESSNSSLAISTRNTRTPRKRLNQTEAAALLSTAYPNIFSANDFSKPCKFIKPYEDISFSFEDDSNELLMPFAVDNPALQIDSIASEKPLSTGAYEYACQANSSNLCDRYEDFDAESILDEEIEDGVIDNIMGKLDSGLEEEITSSNHCNGSFNGVGVPVDFCYGYPLGLGLGLGSRFNLEFGIMREGIAKAFRRNDEGDWWRFAAVNMSEISPRFEKPTSPHKKKKNKKKKKFMKLNGERVSLAQNKESSVLVAKSSSTISKEVSTPHPKSSPTSSSVNSVVVPKSRASMLLKLNYDGVLDAWSEKGSPFTEDRSGAGNFGRDTLEGRLAQIDLFGENGGLRKARVQRYKEKRGSRLFSKKLRYHVRKVNADQRPRIKGRFVRRPNSSEER